MNNVDLKKRHYMGPLRCSVNFGASVLEFRDKQRLQTLHKKYKRFDR